MGNHLRKFTMLLVFFMWNNNIGITEASPPAPPTHTVQFAAVPDGVYTCSGVRFLNPQFKVEMYNHISDPDVPFGTSTLECTATTTTSNQSIQCPGKVLHEAKGPNQHFWHNFWIGVASYTPERRGGTGPWLRPHVGNWGSGVMKGTPTRVSFDSNCKIQVDTQ